MISKSLINPEELSEKTTFDGSPFECRLNYPARLQNASGTAPTVVKNCPNLHKGDLFVITFDEKGTQKLLLQVDEEKLNQPGPAEIHIDESIRKTFSLNRFMRKNPTVQKVLLKENFTLYLVEIQVKEQYLSRGDMWRFTRKLVNTTVYLKKALDIFNMRGTVCGLWIDAPPYRISSGYITKDTKIVFRSLSTCCTIFLQMSKEMWDFDHQGDTYYEKAVDGFLFDLFTRWKNMSCQHDVTMTLFSRVFYNAESKENFPATLRDDINIDNKGRFYEDFYRVIYQNERYDDWLPRLAKIKQVLVNYKEDLLTYRKRKLPKDLAHKMPDGTISCAADGNFLETLNLSSSVFERHYTDRPFDRLGQMSLIITPGAGVFEVERELANMTKQRVLDNGIGSDLVCLGEQPLFAVPLFRFFKKDENAADDYQIPHWMNLSYYHSSTAPSCFKRYIPRLSFDTRRITGGPLDVKNVMNSISSDTFIKPPHMSMEEYDNQVFRSQTKLITKENASDQYVKNGNKHVHRRRHVTEGPKCCSVIEDEESNDEKSNGVMITNGNRGTWTQSNSFVKDDSALSTSHAGLSHVAASLLFSNTYNQSSQLLFHAAQSAHTYFLSSSRSMQMQLRPKALTNPFAPASIRIPMAPGRRRWAHTFPIGPNKIPWHFHHLRQTEDAMKNPRSFSITQYSHLLLPGTSKRILNSVISKRTRNHNKTSSDVSTRQKRILSPSNYEPKREPYERKDSLIDEIRLISMKKSITDGSGKPPLFKKKKEAIIWGPTGVEPWSASMITGIDWKSLTIPASLPTTFDVVPSADELHRDYTQNGYTLIHDLSARFEYDSKRKLMTNGLSHTDKAAINELSERQRITFEEIIDHRLSQGFQLIIEIPNHIEQNMKEAIRRANCHPTDHNRLLSIGKIYHTISLVTIDNHPQDTVVLHVQQYKPQYITQPKKVEYKYRFQCPDSSDYDPAQYDLQLESLESFPWNRIDNVVISHGTGDHKLSDTTKYWHTRLVIIPVSRDYTIRSIESGETKCDSRKEMSREDYFLYVEHFVRFLFMLNKLVRLPVGSNECIHRPLDPNTGKKRAEPRKRYGKPIANFQKFRSADIYANNLQAIENFLSLLRDEQQGLLFVKDTVLPDDAFIAIEAIWWAIEHGEDIEDEESGLALFQTLFKLGYIRHCTNNETSFRFGFFLYYIVTEKFQDFRLELNDYAEVEFHQTQNYIPSMDYLGFSICKPMRLLPQTIDNPQHIARPSRLNSAGYNLSSVVPNQTTSSSIVLKRDCNVDVDPKHFSDRHEWATAHYHSFYNPHCLFELEIRWLVTTSCILSDLISQWSVRTGTILGSNQVAFHLVPIPCDPFAEVDALRGPIYIHMNSSCLLDKLASLPTQQQTARLNVFQELILKRYGFILNACVSYKDEKIYYVHISGGMLVYITTEVCNSRYHRHPTRVVSGETSSNGNSSPSDCGFYWCWNFCLGKRWRSIQTGEEKYQDIMLADFRAFCANENNRLVNFWNEVSEMANQIEAEQQTQVNIDDDSNSEHIANI